MVILVGFQGFGSSVTCFFLQPIILHSCRRTHLPTIFHQPLHLGTESVIVLVTVTLTYVRFERNSLANAVCYSVKVSTPACGHEPLAELIAHIGSALELPEDRARDSPNNPAEPCAPCISNKDALRTLFPTACSLFSGSQTTSLNNTGL